MKQVLPIVAAQTDADQLALLMGDLQKEFPEVSIQKPESTGLGMDPATIALVFGLANVTVPALIAAISAIWVAHLKLQTEKAKQAKEQKQLAEAAKEQPGGKLDKSAGPVIVVDTDLSEIAIRIDPSDVTGSLMMASLPQAADEITRIRLEVGR